MSDRYEEQLALSLLQKHFPIYRELELSDRPDLIDNQRSLGVEVTMALNPHVEEREKYFEKHLKNRNRQEVSVAQLEKVEQYGVSIVDSGDALGDTCGIMLGLIRVFGMEEHEQLHNAIKKKYTKKYANLERIDLYIFFRHVCRAGMSEAEIEKLFRTAYKCQEEYGKIFDNIMIDFYNVLLILDLKDHEMKEIPYEEVG